MRFLVGMLLVLALAGPASARPDARKMTCEQARQMVRQHGAVVMTTGQHTYQRFVSSIGYCDYWQTVRSAWTATRDNPKCRIAYICEDRMDDDFGSRGFRWRHRH